MPDPIQYLDEVPIVTSATGYRVPLVSKTQGAEGQIDLANLLGGVDISADLNLVPTTGKYRADATTLNRPIEELGLVNHVSFDSDTATQEFQSTESFKRFVRHKQNGVWSEWGEIAVVVPGFSLPTDDNVLVEIDTNDLAQWTLTDFTSSNPNPGETLFTNIGSATSLAVATPTNMPTDGDWLLYGTFQSDIAASSNPISLTLLDGATTKMQVSIGFNRETNSGSTVVSMRAENRTADGFQGISSPVMTGAVLQGEHKFCVHFEKNYRVCNFYLHDGTRWVFQGHAECDNVYGDTIQFNQGGSRTTNLLLKELFFARPNFVAYGDSICAGHNGYDPRPAVYSGDDNWLSSWQQYIQPSGLRNNIIVNKGVGGEKSDQILGRINGTLSDTSARVVFIHASSNDWNGTPLTTAQRTANIQNSVNAVTATGAKAVLLNALYANANHVSYPDNGDYYRTWWENERQTITGSAAKIDIMNRLRASDGYLETSLTAADGIHLLVAGYTLIADEINAFIR